MDHAGDYHETTIHSLGRNQPGTDHRFLTTFDASGPFATRMALLCCIQSPDTILRFVACLKSRAMTGSVQGGGYHSPSVVFLVSVDPISGAHCATRCKARPAPSALTTRW